MNAYFIKNLKCLARLADVLGEKETSLWATQLARKSTDSLLLKLYDSKTGTFTNLGGKNEVKSQVSTVVSLIPLIISDLPQSIVEKMVKEQILNSDKFWLPYPIPSIVKDEPKFRVNSRLNGIEYDWRGGTWINTNWFIVYGLRHYGFSEIANKIKEKSVELIMKSGFRESFNPLTGKGIGAKDFSWSTLVIDM